MKWHTNPIERPAIELIKKLKANISQKKDEKGGTCINNGNI